MNRKNKLKLAIGLIEEALAEPNKSIILEERIKQPICEPSIKGISKKELAMMHNDVINSIVELSGTSQYSRFVSCKKVYCMMLPSDNIVIEYNNGSFISKNNYRI